MTLPLPSGLRYRIGVNTDKKRTKMMNMIPTRVGGGEGNTEVTEPRTQLRAKAGNRKSGGKHSTEGLEQRA